MRMRLRYKQESLKNTGKKILKNSLRKDGS
jgi:hypothetical protein